MYQKIALVLFAGTVSIGGALALVLAQSSGLERPSAPQISLQSPQTGTIPRIIETPSRTVEAPIKATPRPVVAPNSEDAVEREAAPNVNKTTDNAQASATSAPMQRPEWSESGSSPALSPYSALSLDNLHDAPGSAPDELTLREVAPVPFSGQRLEETWAIGVYR